MNKIQLLTNQNQGREKKVLYNAKNMNILLLLNTNRHPFVVRYGNFPLRVLP